MTAAYGVIPEVTLNNGKCIPILGLGTWKSKPGEVAQAVKDAIDCGYRHIDCALAYGNELEVGAAILEKITDGTVKREDLFITSKLWNTFHSKQLVIPSLKESLKNLGLDYLDLYLIHWPMGYQEGGALFPKDETGKDLYSDVDYMETWAAMEECVSQALVKSIGLSNFNSKQIQRILKNCAIEPAILQVENHPHLTQQKLLQFCRSKGIAVTAYSPLGSPDRVWAKPEDPVLLEDPVIKEIATKAGRTPAQIMIRYQVQRGVVCIPKSVTRARIRSNFEVFDFELREEDVRKLEALHCQDRALHLNWVKDHPHFPFHEEF